MKLLLTLAVLALAAAASAQGQTLNCCGSGTDRWHIDSSGKFISGGSARAQVQDRITIEIGGNTAVLNVPARAMALWTADTPARNDARPLVDHDDDPMTPDVPQGPALNEAQRLRQVLVDQLRSIQRGIAQNVVADKCADPAQAARIASFAADFGVDPCDR